MKEVSRDTCLFDWATSIFLSSISMAWGHILKVSKVKNWSTPISHKFWHNDTKRFYYLGISLGLSKLNLEVK